MLKYFSIKLVIYEKGCLPLALPTNSEPLPIAELATFLVVSTVVYTVLVTASKIYQKHYFIACFTTLKAGVKYFASSIKFQLS